MRFIHIILICLATTMLSSCSRIKLVYGYGDWLLEIQAHKYLSLNSKADDKLSDDIDAYHAWHRKEMLPRYSALARSLAKGFRGEVKVEDNIREVMPLLRTAWADTVEPMFPVLAEAMASLDESGLKKLEASYAKNNEKQRKLYLEDPEAAKKRLVKRTLGYITDFSGTLTEEQQKKIAEITLATRVPSSAWMEDRIQRQKQLLEMLRQKKGALEVKAMLREWWLRSRINEDDKDKSKMDGADVRVFIHGVVTTLTAEQREKAALRMEEYALIFEELVSK